MKTKNIFNPFTNSFDIIRSEDIPIFLDETSTIADFQTGNTYFYVGKTSITYDYSLEPYPTPTAISNFNFVNLSVHIANFTDGVSNSYALKLSEGLRNLVVQDSGNGYWEIFADEYIDNIYDLQQVTNKGSITTNPPIVRNNPDTYRTRYSIIGQGIERDDLGFNLNYYDNGITKLATGSKTWELQMPDLTGNANSSSFIVDFRPNVSGTVAYLDDINQIRFLSQSGNINAGSLANKYYYYSFSALGQLTLPTAVGNTSVYQVKNASNVNITVVFTGGQTADGSTTITLIPFQSLTFISNNINYDIN